MSTQEVANRLVEICRTGQYGAALNELYSPHAVSIEPEGSPGETVARGIDALKAKGKQWEESVEAVHSSEVSDPIVAGNFFACTMSLDITFKGMGRMPMDEVCVYEVQDGKVVSEQFFYPVMPQG